MSTKNTEKIAVTGGTGFLGSHILRGLVEKGYTYIFALKRKTSSLELVSDIQHKIQWVEGDVLDVVSLQELVDGATNIIHSAAKVSYNPKDRDSVYEVNVEGTKNVVNACLDAKVGKLLFVSSVAAIGRALLDHRISESTEWNHGPENSSYGISKHLAELEVWRGMAEGLKVGILNPSMILGPSFWGDSSTKLFTYVEQKKRFYPTGKNGFVDVRDVAKLTILFLESKEVVNLRVIAVSEQRSYKQLLEEIAAELGVPAPNKPLRAFLAKIICRIYSLQKDPTITKETVEITSSNFDYDNSLSRELFAYTYHSVESSIKDTVLELKESRAKKKKFAFFDKVFF